MEEFQSVGNFKTNANADAFIKNMVRDKIIVKDSITPRTFSYRVISDETVRIVRAADPLKKKYTVLEIKEMAIQWSWENQSDYNDLHKFIETITTKEQSDGRTEGHTEKSESN